MSLIYAIYRVDQVCTEMILTQWRSFGPAFCHWSLGYDDINLKASKQSNFAELLFCVGKLGAMTKNVAMFFVCFWIKGYS